MTSRLVTFRIPEDLYKSFQEKCSDEDQTASEKLRHFIDDYLYPSSQLKDVAPSETEEGKKPNTEERFSAFDNRIKPIEREMEIFGEFRITTQRQLDDIQETLSEIVDAISEGEPTPAPGEIDIEGEHLDRVQNNPEESKEVPEKELEEEPVKVEDKGGEDIESKEHFDWPWFKEPEKEPEKKGEVP